MQAPKPLRPHQPATPTGSRPGSRASSRPGTPRHRPGTPSRVVTNMADDYMKHPPNNLNLIDPREQDRASDLIGARGTEPLQDPPSEEEMRRVREMADRINK